MQSNGISLVTPILPSPGAASEVRSEPPSASLSWEDGKGSSCDVVLGRPWVGQLEACGHFWKGNEK